MPDYAACDAKTCEKRKTCARYLMKPSEYMQTYILVEDTENCKMYLDYKKGTCFKLRRLDEIEGE